MLVDLQDASNTTHVRTASELRCALLSARRCTPFVAELCGARGRKLTLGLGGDVGFVQFSVGDEPPYLVGIDPRRAGVAGVASFLITDTPTEIPLRHCVSFATLTATASHFFETGERAPGVTWIDVGDLV